MEKHSMLEDNTKKSAVASFGQVFRKRSLTCRGIPDTSEVLSFGNVVGFSLSLQYGANRDGSPTLARPQNHAAFSKPRPDPTRVPRNNAGTPRCPLAAPLPCWRVGV